MAAVSAEEVYYVVLRTVVAGKQTNWAVMGHMAQLRQLMGVSDDLHKQYMEQVQADPEVCAINGSQPPAPKRQKTTAAPPAAAAAAANRQAKPARPRAGRSSEQGYVVPAPPPIPTYGLPNRVAPHQDPHGLVGMRVNIIQEDDSTVEGMVVDYNEADQTHIVMCNIGQPDEAAEPLPLVEYPDAYQNLGPHPDYVSPIPPAPVPASQLAMPPPAARPRTNSYSGAAGGGSGAKPPKQRKPPTVRTGGGGGGSGGGGSGAARLGPPPYNVAALEARLAVADIAELANMLSAISRKERSIMAELESAGLMDEELSRSVMEREELVRQITAH